MEWRKEDERRAEEKTKEEKRGEYNGWNGAERYKKEIEKVEYKIKLCNK